MSAAYDHAVGLQYRSWDWLAGRPCTATTGLKFIEPYPGGEALGRSSCVRTAVHTYIYTRVLRVNICACACVRCVWRHIIIYFGRGTRAQPHTCRAVSPTQRAQGTGAELRVRGSAALARAVARKASCARPFRRVRVGCIRARACTPPPPFRVLGYVYGGVHDLLRVVSDAHAHANTRGVDFRFHFLRRRRRHGR